MNGGGAINLPIASLDTFRDFSVEMWVNTANQQGTLLSAASNGEPDEALLRLVPGGLQVVFAGESHIVNGINIADEEFHHIVSQVFFG